MNASKELESQDRRGLNRESNRQLRLRTIHRITYDSRSSGVLVYYDRHRSEFHRRDMVMPESEMLLLDTGLALSCQSKRVMPPR